MRPIRRLKQRRKSRAFKMLLAPIFERFKPENLLESRGYRPLQMTFDDQLKALIFFHLEEYSSASAMLQAFEQNDFARDASHLPRGSKRAPSSRRLTTVALNSLAKYSRILSRKLLM